MFGSTVLEVAVGLTFCYATVALIVSTVQEALASAMRLRARVLLGGIKTMLNDPDFNALAQKVYAHALVNPHDDGSAASQASLKSKPSYIESKHFAIALIDSIQSVPGRFEQLAGDIDRLPDPQLKRVLQGLYSRAEGDMAKLQDSVAGWYDSAMERVSGAYKRRSLLISFLLAMLLSLLFNIDSIHLFRSLWEHPALTAQLKAAPDAVNQQTIDALFVLPIGWAHFPVKLDGAFALSVAGWLLTAATTLFGAPFWFDMFQRTVNLRATGSKPEPRTRPREIEAVAAVVQA